MQMALAVESIEILLVEKGSSSAPAQNKLSYYTPTYKGTVTYSAHVENNGWMDSVADGAVAGTQGKSLQMEALKINLSSLKDETGAALGGTVRYRAHVQDYGWKSWSQNGQIAGTTGEKKRMEAVQIQLTGAVAEKYDIYYRVHVATFGTLGWAKNGETAGTVGFAAPIESIEIKLYAKGASGAPAQGARSYLDKAMIGNFEYSVSFKGSGWSAALSNGRSVRKSGGTIDAVRFSLTGGNGDFGGTVNYKAHIQNTGWTGSATGGQALGTPGSGLRVEAVQLSLSGEIAKYCDIYYRTCVERYGWLGWAKNGQSAGTSGIACRMEGIEIKIQPKTVAAPGSNSNYFRDTKDPKTALMELSTAQNTILLSNTKYQLTSAERSSLQNAIARFSWSGAKVGFVMLDIKSGQILAYNPSVGLYSASCIKGPYVLSLLESGVRPNTTMYNTISWSSNSDYSALRKTYGSAGFRSWLTQAGVNANQGNSLYTTTTSVDLAKMWLKGYGYLAGNAANSSWARSTFQRTLNSTISSQLRSRCTVYSKAGWIAQGGYYNVYTDAGIVMDGSHPYVMAIMSSLPGPSGSAQMKNLAQVVYNIHKNMVK